jgi:dTDP-glucose 4,6-dehydratase/dTDP-4-dehydrorhamnose 3,5-epimerase
MSFSNKITKLEIADAFLVSGKRFLDERGFFQEIYNETKFEQPITERWKQASLSKSKANVIRGLHCSNYAKFVQCLSGEVYDVIVDLRPDSPTFMKWQGVWLNGDDLENPIHLYVPKRCGHGFFCKKDSLFLYLQDGAYNPKEDIELNLFDEIIKVDWPKPVDGAQDYIISQKDRTNPKFNQLKDKILKSQTVNDLANRKENFNIFLPKFSPKKELFLVYGANYFLGKYFVNYLARTNKSFQIGSNDFHDKNSLQNEIEKVAPSHIFCFNELALQDNSLWYETNKLDEIRKNFLYISLLAQISNELNIHSTFLALNQNTTSSDNLILQLNSFQNAFFNSFENILRIKLSYLLSSDLHPTSILNKLLKFKTIESFPLSISVVDDTLPLILNLAEKRIVGKFSLSNPGKITQDDLLQIYKKSINSDHEYKVVKSHMLLDDSSDENITDLSYKLPTIKQSIETVMSHLKENIQQETQQINEKFVPKNILLTGGAGFIGSHVAIHLVKTYKHYNVFVLDILDYCANLKNLDEIKDEPNFKFIKGDICNFEMVKFVMEQFEIDCVMHFAAQSHVDLSIRNSLSFTEVNIKGTHVLLENARRCNVKRFIHVSTDEVYGTTDEEANIDQALQPTNPYACSKLGAECIIMAYQKCFKMPIVISRGNNVYGPHQFLEKVIPKFIMRLLKDQKCCIHGDGSSERDFLYISDVVNAFDVLLHNGIPHHFYNIGASKGVRIADLAKIIVRQIKNTEEGKEDEYIEYVEDRILDDKRYKIDSSKIKSLGWKQQVSFEEGIKKTIAWYMSHQNYWQNSDYALQPHPKEKP